MRLSPRQREVINEVLRRHFGEQTRVLLFGSRVDDSKRGGDIDLYVEPQIQSPAVLIDAKFAALVELKQKLGDQKIDLVIHRPEAPLLPVHQVALREGVAL